MIKIRIVEFISFSFLLNLAVGASAEIYTNKQDCLVKNGSDASWLCDNLVYEDDKEKTKAQQIKEREKVEQEAKQNQWNQTIESWKTPPWENEDPNLIEYCKNIYKQQTPQNLSSFSFRYPQCKNLIPYLRPIITPELMQYCISQYKNLSKYYSDFDFTYRYPECMDMPPSLKSQILKENQDSKPQPATKELDEKNSNQTKENYAETNNVSAPATKEMRDKNYKQIDSKKKDKKK